MSDPEVVTLVNEVLDRARRRLGAKSDHQLALRLGTNPINIGRWRKGQIGESSEILIPLALAADQPEPASPPD